MLSGGNSARIWSIAETDTQPRAGDQNAGLRVLSKLSLELLFRNAWAVRQFRPVTHTLIFTGGTNSSIQQKWISGNFQTRESGSQCYQFISGIWCFLAFQRIESFNVPV